MTEEPVRKKYDKERVLNLWAEGKELEEICKLLDASGPGPMSIIVQRARAAGDPRAHRRRGKPPTNDVASGGSLVGLEVNVRRVIAAEASQRDMTIQELCLSLLSIVANDRLFKAILDG